MEPAFTLVRRTWARRGLRSSRGAVSAGLRAGASRAQDPAGRRAWGRGRARVPAVLGGAAGDSRRPLAAAMPLHKYPVHLWKQLRLREGLCSRLPAHYLRSLEPGRQPTPVHYRPHGAKFKVNPKNGQRERVEDVPIPIYYPPESQQGLWGGEGWILGHRYVNNDKVGEGYSAWGLTGGGTC